MTYAGGRVDLALGTTGLLVNIRQTSPSKTVNPLSECDAEKSISYQSPQREMSRTSCWGVKNWLMSQDEPEGYEADGVPQEEGSTVLVALFTESGTSLRCKESVSAPH